MTNNDLPLCIDSCNITLFAYDPSVYKSEKGIKLSQLKIDMEKDLAKIYEWLEYNKAKLNFSEIQCLFIETNKSTTYCKNFSVLVNIEEVVRVLVTGENTW